MQIVPNSTAILGGLSVTGPIVSFTNQISSDSFGDLRVVQKSNIVELKSVYGISTLRDVVTTTGGGTVTNDFTEYRLYVPGTIGDSAMLRSAESGRYVAGYDSDTGIGIRMASDWPSACRAYWGSITNTDGFYFGTDPSGLYVAIRRNGVEIQKVYREDWNGDTLDGTGPSGLTLDVTRGNIYQIVFSWYGYGSIRYKIIIPVDGIPHVVTVHCAQVNGQTSTTTPNLPLTAAIETLTGTIPAASLYVGGRQFSIVGSYNPNSRIISHMLPIPSTINVTTSSWVPIFALRKKNLGATTSIKIQGLEVFCTGTNMYCQIRMVPNADVVATYTTPSDTPINETVCEVATTITSSGSGTPLYMFGVLGSSNRNTIALGSRDDLFYDIPSHLTAVVLMRAISGTGDVQGAVLRWREDW